MSWRNDDTKFVREINERLTQLFVSYNKTLSSTGILLGRLYSSIVFMQYPEFSGSIETLVKLYHTIENIKEEILKIKQQYEKLENEIEMIVNSVKNSLKIEDIGNVFPIYSSLKSLMKIIKHMIDDAISVTETVNNIDTLKRRVIIVNQLTTSDEISVYRFGLKLLREISDFKKFQKLVETLYYSLISSSGLDDETKRQIASDYIKTLRSSLEYINSTKKEVEKTTKIVETFILDIKGSRFEELLLSLVNEYKTSFNSLIKTVKDTLNEVNRMGFDLGIVRN
ncbi:hypothetical protein [Stygiolobus sp. RP850M]|uniref:hypothetical protein n=1 Tax=Stygiolobus sp. RP850M TaxID=3133137 RepID=UPI00307EE261